MANLEFNPVKAFNTVVRLNEKHPSISSLEIYKSITEGVIKGTQNFSTYRASIEFTLSSVDIEECFPKLLEEYSKYINICIGTVCTLEQAKKVVEWQKILKNRELTAFSPYFDAEIFEFFKDKKINYVPGLTDINNYEEYKKHNNALNPCIKVFPSMLDTREQLLAAIQGPFPELIKEKDRIILNEGFKPQERTEEPEAKTEDKESEAEGEEKAETEKEEKNRVIEISSPLEYSKIREEFLKDKDLKIKITIPRNSGSKLIYHIKRDLSSANITATGISSLDKRSIKDFFNSGASSIGSSITVKDPITMLLENKINLKEVKARISNNIKEAYDFLNNLDLKSKRLQATS